MKNGEKNRDLDLFSNISRRDFVGGTLVGFGAGLLGSCSKPQSGVGVFNDPWTGFGGVGDYAVSNGNVASVRAAAHLIRDGYTGEMMGNTEDTGEEYDMVIIGGGFSGIGAAYQFHKQYGNSKKCLILENHPVLISGKPECDPLGRCIGSSDGDDDVLLAFRHVRHRPAGDSGR